MALNAWNVPSKTHVNFLSPTSQVTVGQQENGLPISQGRQTPSHMSRTCRRRVVDATHKQWSEPKREQQPGARMQHPFHHEHEPNQRMMGNHHQIEARASTVGSQRRIQQDQTARGEQLVHERNNHAIHSTLELEVEVRMPHNCISGKDHWKVRGGTNVPRNLEQLLPKCVSLALNQTCVGRTERTDAH